MHVTVKMIRRGLFAVYKPPGVTSAEVTNKLKVTLLSQVGSHDGTSDGDLTDHQGQTAQSNRVHKRLKIGHGGTLDKFAEGVLVIGVGQDCKKLGYFQKSVIKEYKVIGRLGVTTDTLDPNGTVTDRKDWEYITMESLRYTLECFRGEITQSTPLYSAVKHKGRRLSDYARSSDQTGVPSGITPPLRQVHIHSISLLDFAPPDFHMVVSCSSGTYIRSLVCDIAEKLGTVGHVVHLCRTVQGPFQIHHALRSGEGSEWSLESIRLAIEKGKALMVQIEAGGEL